MFSEKDFREKIPDEGIRSYILERTGDKPFSNVWDYYTIFHNIINLTFMYAFSCYTDLRNRNVSDGDKLGALDKCRQNGNANSLRVFRTMEKIYKEYPLTNELIQFVLLDIQFDFRSGENSKLRKCIPNCFTAEQVQLNDYFSMVNLSLVSSRLVDYSLAELKEKLGELIDILPFLKKSALKYSEEAGWYYFEVTPNDIYKDGKIYTYGLIHRIKQGKRSEFYYLVSVEKACLRYENRGASKTCAAKGEGAPFTGGEITSPYDLSWDYEAVYTYLVPSFFKEGAQPHKGKKTKIEQLFNINYKYIKNLALAVSDAVGQPNYKHVWEQFETEYKNSYPEIFKNYQDTVENRDSIIVMLLIEAGPSRVLKALFLISPSIANNVLRNLKNRFGADFSETVKDIDDGDDFDEVANGMINISQLHLGDQPVETTTYKKLRDELLAEAKAAVILSAISDMKQEMKYGYVGNIGQGVESLENFPSDNPARLCQAIRATLGVVLKRITCFYAGLFAYGEKKLEYDKKSESRPLPQEEIEKYQNLCKNAFKSAAEKQWKAFSELPDKDSVKAVLQAFLVLCNKCGEGGSNCGRSNESRCLYAVLGKYTILDVDVFKQKIGDVETLADLSHENATEWRDMAIRMMRYFATGSFEKSGETAQYFQHAIAPVVASYISSSNSKDGYDTSTFYLTIDVNGNNIAEYHKKINVLSEFSYDMRTQYYSLPNVVRSSDKWWIDPFMIECNIIDKICTRK
ncbi:MAG: hypothetical protein J1F39_01200 [Clostridiales bacterium]|nr:hypothetical protein [Clostridiales bacterium]